MSFSVRLFSKYLCFDSQFSFVRSSDYYQCESVEDIPENDTRSCQVKFSQKIWFLFPT